MGYRNLFYLISLPFFIIFFKWGITFYYLSDLAIDLKILLNFNDASYFPFIISLSDINFSPSFNDYFLTEGVTSFPYASIIFHTILFKFFDLQGLVVAELLFCISGYLLVCYFLRKSGISNLSSILVTFLIFFSPVILEYVSFFFSNENFSNLKDSIFAYHLNSQRFPRPLVTNIFFYLSLISLLNFVKNDFKIKKDYLLFGVILSLLLQSFIYLFLVVGFSFFIILLLNLMSHKDSFKEKFKHIQLLIIIFLLLSLPFILQNIFVEEDYAARMGLFSVNLEEKKLLFQKTIDHYLKIKNLIYGSVVFGFYILFKKKFSSKYLLSFRVYLVLLISSFIAPLIFIILSPYVIWFKHFFDVKNLIFIMGIILISAFIIESFKEKLLTKNFLSILYIFILGCNIFYYSLSASNNYAKNKDRWADLSKVIIKSNDIINNKTNSIFSNSDLINYYYTYKHQNISYPDGFHTSLDDNQLENQMINSFKSIGYSNSDFKEYLANKISWRSFNEIAQISGYKYQFSSLHTFFDINDYSKKEIEFLKNQKLFLSESIALSKKEISRLVDKFEKHQIIEEIKPNILIIDKGENIMKFVLSNEYSKILDTKFFSLIILN